MRLGCLTCKKRRVKCDETRPTCLRCEGVRANCEGYQGKEYRWRVVKDVARPRPQGRRTENATRIVTFASPPHSLSTPSTDMDAAFATAARAFRNPTDPHEADKARTRRVAVDPEASPPSLHPFPTSRSARGECGGSQTSSPHASPDGSPATPVMAPSLEETDASLLAATDESLPQSTKLLDVSFEELLPGFESLDEDVNWPWEAADTFSDKWSAFSQSLGSPLLMQPQLSLSAPEMLMLHFDKETCGILSVKYGPNENPWRILIWPLTKDSLALHHAIASMTAFHGSYDVPNLVMPGTEHEIESMRYLEAHINDTKEDVALATLMVLVFTEAWKFPTNTTHQHLRSAKGLVTKAIMRDQGTMRFLSSATQESMRLRFLCNAYVYMDVIARLTNTEDDDDLTSEIVSAVNYPIDGLMEVDPLLGCAASLFPLISKVTSLIHKLQKLERSSLSLISHAQHLQEQLQQRQAPTLAMLEGIEEQSEVLHTIQTAEALRYAALLLIYQAVPELPSIPTEELARKILTRLATTPTMSRATNLQILPLFVASCEMTSEEDRNWVRKRWEALIARLKVANVDRSWQVVQEVWARRDAYTGRKRVRSDSQNSLDTVPLGARSLAAPAAIPSLDMEGFTSSDLVSTDIPSVSRPSIEIRTDVLAEVYSIRGELHWLRIMKDLQWQVFLG